MLSFLGSSGQLWWRRDGGMTMPSLHSLTSSVVVLVLSTTLQLLGLLEELKALGAPTHITYEWRPLQGEASV